MKLKKGTKVRSTSKIWASEGWLMADVGETGTILNGNGHYEVQFDDFSAIMNEDEFEVVAPLPEPTSKGIKEPNNVILYQGCGEILVTTTEREEAFLLEFFEEGGRDQDLYDRTVGHGVGMHIVSELKFR